MAKYLDKDGLTYYDGKIKAVVNKKQDKLVSGQNIKTVNGQSILGSGDVTVGGGDVNLYKHHIDIAGEYTPYKIGTAFAQGNVAFIEFYSSNNLKVDSVTKLRTLLGTNFTIGCNGSGYDDTDAAYIILDYMDEAYLYGFSTTTFDYISVPLSALTFIDNVKPI